MVATVLVIACGAIAHELVRIREVNGWDHVEFQCLPAELHNTPDKIPAAVIARIEREKQNFQSIFVAYADCGTGGLLDKVRIATSFLPAARCFTNWPMKNLEVFT